MTPNEQVHAAVAAFDEAHGSLSPIVRTKATIHTMFWTDVRRAVRSSTVKYGVVVQSIISRGIFFVDTEMIVSGPEREVSSFERELKEVFG